LIPKVNSTPLLRVVPEPRSMENDPGSSQGSGVADEGPPGRTEDTESECKSDAPAETEAKPGLRVVVPVEQSGMTEVVREFHENKKDREPSAGLTTRYQPSAGNTKGLLLNRKVE
jgi:hypothetical protein